MAPLAPLELTTARLRLRQFDHADFDAFALISADAEVMRFIGDGKVTSREDSWRTMAAFLGHWALLGYGMWVLERRDDGRFIGRAGFVDRPGWPGFELGWLLARDQWGQGLAQEAARAALEVAFGTLRRREVISLIRPDNERSKRVARALGFSNAGTVELFGSSAERWRIDAAGAAASAR